MPQSNKKLDEVLKSVYATGYGAGSDMMMGLPNLDTVDVVAEAKQSIREAIERATSKAYDDMTGMGGMIDDSYIRAYSYSIGIMTGHLLKELGLDDSVK